ncbi:MAG: DUF4349 domain-containing protein [Leptospiraceae bacterium]|nr:DUF4349 domain-containing protein [Leptospiraceae bacterium]
MNRRFLWTFAGSVAFILLIFMLRLGYGLLVQPSAAVRFARIAQCGGTEESQSIRNYASKKIQRSYNQLPVVVDQKYEKVGTLAAGSGDFAADEKKLRDQIQADAALIQYERRSGLASQRCLYMAIGVQPEKFDSFIAALQTIGHLQKLQINKTDKTNEFKEMKAKKASLFEMRTALLNLKNRPGKIEEYIKLENRILEVEREIQSLGISLGEYDAENEFCTVRFTLAEGSVLAGPGFFGIALQSLLWTVQYGFLVALLLFFSSLAVYIGILILARIWPLVSQQLSVMKGRVKL